jgi:hypothetical protein
MPLTCGVTLNLNNLKGDLEARAQAILNINLGTPEGLSEIAGKIQGELSAIGDKIAAVVVIPPINLSLREELAALAALPLASLAAAAKIISIAEEFAEAIGLQGFVNLNLNDLSKSVFSLSTTFDPCNPTIPNILKGPDGTLQKLPSIQPILGSTEAALKTAVPTKSTIDNLSKAMEDNLPITDELSTSALDQALVAEKSTIAGLSEGLNTLQTQSPALLSEIQSQTPALVDSLQQQAPAAISQVNKEVSTTMKALEKNVTPSLSGMDNMIRTLPSGQEVVETQDFFIKRIQNTNLPLLTEV